MREMSISEWKTYSFRYLETIFHSGRSAQNLLVTVQSFERYIIICKPHLKEGLTLPKMIFSLVSCLLLGILKGVLHYRAVVEFEESEYLDNAFSAMLGQDDDYVES